jgi:hypothetical protein
MSQIPAQFLIYNNSSKDTEKRINQQMKENDRMRA